jgi:ADP-ribose pyrophosphatase YjhB (NUDIX family)/ubiquinone/menaquinone biosynthesis C-methylase UbiE
MNEALAAVQAPDTAAWQRATIETYDRIAPVYAEHWYAAASRDHPERFVAMMRRTKPGPGWLVLDAGCGSGQHLLRLRELGCKVVGADLSAGMLAEARRRTGSALLVRMDLRRPAFAAHRFHGIWASASLLHLDRAEILPVLRAFYQLLDHGYLYVSMKEGTGSELRSDAAYDGAPRFFTYVTEYEMRLWLEQAGFQVLDFVRGEPGADGHAWLCFFAWTKIITPLIAVCAVIRDRDGRVLLARRTDNGLWCLPGGAMEVGETVEAAVRREVREETGLEVALDEPPLFGVYSEPRPGARRHVVVLGFRCRVVGGALTPSDETTDFQYVRPEALPDDLVPTHRQRIVDALSGRTAAFVR